MKEQNSFKDDFIRKTRQQLIVYKNLLTGLQSCEPIISSFGNKVLNARFANAAKEVNTGNKLSFRLEDKNELTVSDHYNRSYANIRNKCTSYVDSNSYSFRLITNSEGRLLPDETIIELQKAIRQITDAIKSYEKDIDTYDQFVKEVAGVTSFIKDFENNYSYHIRNHHIKLEYRTLF